MRTYSSHLSTRSSICRQRQCWILAILLCMHSLSGCAQMAVVGRIFYGEPKSKGFFEQMTGRSLKKEGARVAIVCTAPDVISSEYDMVSLDVQEELTRIMRRQEIEMVDSNEIANVLDKNGGVFDVQVIADGIDADYLFHVDIEHFSHLVPNSPRLYHGHSNGNVYGYELRKADENSDVKQAFQVFERQFDTVYPGKNPIPADQTPERVFRNRFIGHLSEEVGRMFYTFQLKDTFASR